jgi:23S rRNA (adenine2503-C2)-methyltransferase
MKSINDLTRDELREVLTQLGEPAYRAAQVSEWLHRRRAMGFGDMTNLPLALRRSLAKHFKVTRVSKLKDTVSAADGTAKYVLGLADGARIESVFLPHPRGATLCISTQVGCAYRCRFCATGRMGLKRNLTAGEIVDQVSFFKEYLPLDEDAPKSDTARAFSNLVFMGMGEPLANYDNLMKAISILTKEIGIGSRRMTVSTSGLPDEIMRLAKEPYEVSLAISLNSPFDKRRRELMPVAGRTPLGELLSAARYYFARRNRILTFEYVLVAGVNDRMKDAHQLAALVRDIPAKVNLIALNPFPGCRYESPDKDRVRRFQSVLRERGKKVTLRKSLGCDILAACGQLGAEQRKRGR